MCNDHHNKLKSNNKDLQEIEKQLDRRNFLKENIFRNWSIGFGELIRC